MLGFVARATGATADNPTWLSQGLQILGNTFVTLLRAVVPPLVFLAIVSSIANLRQVTGAARLAMGRCCGSRAPRSSPSPSG